MTNKYNKILGKFGEDAACEYLKSKNHTIVARNFRCPQGEVDIISRFGDCLTFIEVKTRKNSEFGEPAEAVDFRKVEKIIKVIDFYLASNEWTGDIKIDVIEVIGNVEFGRFFVESINHIEDIMN